MKLTEEEYLFCETHIELIKKIVRTASSSYINPEYREGLITLGKKYKIMNCQVCNSSLYLGTCRLFYMYDADRIEKELLQASQNAENVTIEEPKSDNNINTKPTKKRASKTKKSAETK